MPKKRIEREPEGKAPSTQAGEFVREEIDLIREGAHGARSTKQAIAIDLSKARRAGVKLPPPKKGTVPEETRKKAKRDLEKARKGARQSRENVHKPRSRRSSTKGVPPRRKKHSRSTPARSLAARALPNAPPPRKRPLELVVRSDKPCSLCDLFRAVIGERVRYKNRLAAVSCARGKWLCWGMQGGADGCRYRSPPRPGGGFEGPQWLSGRVSNRRKI